MDKGLVVIPFDGDNGDICSFEFGEDLLGLPQVGGLDLGTIKKITRNQESVSLFRDGLTRDKSESIGQVFIRPPPVETPASEVNVCGVNELHGVVLRLTENGVERLT